MFADPAASRVSACVLLVLAVRIQTGSDIPDYQDMHALTLIKWIKNEVRRRGYMCVLK